MPDLVHLSVHVVEVLDEAAYTEVELAHACDRPIDWVRERVEAGLLQPDQSTGEWRFGCDTLLRARRMASLERTFDADPQLAALTADLIEEVTRLRRRVSALEGGS
jgi:chaperone modulatory protein CbpM